MRREQIAFVDDFVLCTHVIAYEFILYIILCTRTHLPLGLARYTFRTTFPLRRTSLRRLLLELLSCGTLGLDSSWMVWSTWMVRPGREQVTMAVCIGVGVAVAAIYQRPQMFDQKNWTLTLDVLLGVQLDCTLRQPPLLCWWMIEKFCPVLLLPHFTNKHHIKC